MAECVSFTFYVFRLILCFELLFDATQQIQLKHNEFEEKAHRGSNDSKWFPGFP